MKKALNLHELDLVLQQIASDFSLTREEVNDIYLTLLSEEARSEALEQELGQQIIEFLKAIGLGVEDAAEFDPESLPSLMSSSIYNLQSDEELAKLKDIEDNRLNEGCGSVENLSVLEAQARTYFANPNRYYLAEELDARPQVTGYISLYSHTLFDLNGKPVDIYKATGVSFILPLEKALTLDGIAEGVNTMGYELNESIQVKLYGNALYELVGAKPYKENEVTEFVRHFQECSNILFAIPDSQTVCDRQDGIYESLDKLVNEEIIYGRGASEVLGQAYNHWSLTQEFYEIRLPEMEEEKLSLEHEKKLAVLIEKKTEFRDGFSKEVKIVKALNRKECSLSDLAQLSVHELNRILFVCRSDEFAVRLESKSVYMQLKSTSHRKSQYETHPVSTSVALAGSEEARGVIDYINGGGMLDVDRLDIETLNDIFSLLWDKHSQVRIAPKYKAVYFILKERYLYLKDTIPSRIAA